MRPRLAIAFGLAVTAGWTGCGDPCRALSDKICRCETDPAARAACLARVASRAARAPSGADGEALAQRERCASLIDGCTCAALAAGDLDACGLGAPPARPAADGAADKAVDGPQPQPEI